jgi:hypothetical protein
MGAQKKLISTIGHRPAALAPQAMNFLLNIGKPGRKNACKSEMKA